MDALGFVACSLLLASSTQPWPCGERWFDLPGKWEYRGSYKNPYYGFAVDLPGDLVGKNDPPPAPDRGIGVQLGEHPRSYAYIAARDSAGDQLDESLEEQLALLKNAELQQLSVRRLRTTLGGLPATRYIATYACGGTTELFIDDVTLAQRPGGELTYEVTLLTTASRQRQDRETLDRILRTWRMIPEVH
jgi:hypothetical protein